MARKGLLSPLALRGASLLFLNLCLPCQLFASVVSSITTANSPAIGPIFLTATFYQASCVSHTDILTERGVATWRGTGHLD